MLFAYAHVNNSDRQPALEGPPFGLENSELITSLILNSAALCTTNSSHLLDLHLDTLTATIKTSVAELAHYMEFPPYRMHKSHEINLPQANNKLTHFSTMT